MPFLVSLKQRSFLGILPLRAGVFVLGVLQTLEGALLLTRYQGHESTVLRRLSILVALCNIADGLTATYTSWRPAILMALATACGFLLDAILHCCMFIVRWEELYGSLKDWVSVSYVISHIAIFFVLIYMVRTSFTLYQVLKVRSAASKIFLSSAVREWTIGLQPICWKTS